MLNTDYSRVKAPNLATSSPTRSPVIPFVAHLLCSLLPFMPLLRRPSRLINKTALSFASLRSFKVSPSSLWAELPAGGSAQRIWARLAVRAKKGQRAFPIKGSFNIHPIVGAGVFGNSAVPVVPPDVF